MTRHRCVRFESPAFFGLASEVLDLFGEDALNHLFSFDVRLLLPGVPVTPAIERELLRRPAALLFEDNGADVSRYEGLLARVQHERHPTEDAALLTLTLVPRAWLLTQTRRSEIFVDRSVPEVLADKLAGADLQEGHDFVFALRDAYPARELIAQHAETDFDFISRLCEDLGIVFFFRRHGDRSVLHFTDTRDTFEPLEHPLGVADSAATGARRDHRAAFDVARSLHRVPECALVHDYNHRAPRLDLLAATPTGKDLSQGGYIEYGIHAKTPEDAAHRARVRAEEIGAAHETLRARSTELALCAGATVVFIDMAGAERLLLLTRVLHRAHLPGEDDARGERTLHNEFTAIPAGVMYRPPRITQRPRVPGLCHAVVLGDPRAADEAASGAYADLDEAGRYRIRFRHDLAADRRNSRPVRMLQPHAGAHYGVHFPLRPGIEVLIAFVEGDPDRPVIVGAVPNAETPSPVDRANPTQNILRTASGNELLLDDLTDRERVRLHTPHTAATLHLGAPGEPERGALLATDDSIALTAARAITQATDRSVLLAGENASLTGGNTAVFAGVQALVSATQTGMQLIASLAQHRDTIAAGLERIAGPPDDVTPASASPDDRPTLYSDLAADLAASAHDALARSIAAAATSADAHIEKSRGRLDAPPIGSPAAPTATVASLGTAALLARDTAIVAADRLAALSSPETATVIGGNIAQLKSPHRIDLAAGREASLTSAGTADLQAAAVRIVGGYYPDREPRPLRPKTSVGVLAKGELHLRSAEDCVLLCGHSNVILAAHTGSLKLRAKQTATISAGAVSVRGGPVGIEATGITLEATGDISIKADGAVRIEAATVEIAAGTIALKGPVQIAGDLQVTGTINGKRL